MNQPRRSPDPWTVLAIGAVAYVVSNLVHEGLGHGGAAVLVGARPQALSSAWFLSDMSGVGPWGVRAVKAGGTVANLVLGGVLFLLVRSFRRPSPHLYYLAWLTMTVSLLKGGGYLMTSPFIGFGDWKEFIEGLEPALGYKIGFTLLGVALSFAALFAGIRTADPILGREGAERFRRAAWMCWLPYVVAGGVLFSVAALFNPGGPIFIATSAAAHLGGTAWLAWLPAWIGKDRPDAVFLGEVSRHPGWIVAGVAAAAFCIFVLGPGIGTVPQR
jgi:hypothetical protein